ncbi:hypothetical protein FOC1_g10004556 [Fusarium oxysporum f. sp. cubense race 1]|uniref:Acyltransferase 3 domain-containing protein n=1 Tax=Fusarium oxysporum f. sp. cubense (strain race 1) TaxID=1229664 RepID=N4UQC2_FUSC1|nr:hypothetical protein FOC1_g10004556 [Fusarium oxysporum f. sp. cubense race 1]
MTSRQEGRIQWIEGLRGIASTLVWIAHVTRAFDLDLYSPVSGEGLRPRLLQLPFLRIMIQGRLGVIIFIYVTGYVCALKPLTLFRRGNYEADGFLSVSSTPGPELGISTTFTRARSSNSSKAESSCCSYFMQFWWGVFMNDLHNSRVSQRISWSKSRYIPFLGFLSVGVGLFIASFPESRIELASWSRWQDQILSAIVPKDSEFPKFASSFGFCLLTIGGALLPGYTDILSHPERFTSQFVAYIRQEEIKGSSLV